MSAFDTGNVALVTGAASGIDETMPEQDRRRISMPLPLQFQRSTNR